MCDRRLARRIRILGWLPLLILAGSCARTGSLREAPAEQAVVCFDNGQWFDGAGFVPATFCSAGGVLRQRADPRAAQRIDLAGGYVVPAFGEAHNHNVGLPPRPDEVLRYQEAGVAYVLILNNLSPKPGDRELAKAAGLEVLYANGGLTGSGGHVVELYERLVAQDVLDIPKEELDGLAFFVVDSEADLERQWPRLLATGPDLVKVYLSAAEEHAARRDNPAFYGKRGLDPALLPDIVRRAHDAGLRVAVHIETAFDFRTAVAAGVDIVAHLPGWRVGEEAGFADARADRWLLTSADARQAAARGTFVITTALASQAVLDSSHPHHTLVRDLYKRNLQTLTTAGVRLALGSDFWNGTSLTEALLLG